MLNRAGQKSPFLSFSFDLLALFTIALSTLPQSVRRQMGYQENLSNPREEMLEFLGERGGESRLQNSKTHLSPREFPKVGGSVHA